MMGSAVVLGYMWIGQFPGHSTTRNAVPFQVPIQDFDTTPAVLILLLLVKAALELLTNLGCITACLYHHYLPPCHSASVGSI